MTISSVNFNKEEFINPFLPNIPILYSLKTSENLWFSDVFRGYKMGTLGTNRLIIFFHFDYEIIVSKF